MSTTPPSADKEAEPLPINTKQVSFADPQDNDDEIPLPSTQVKDDLPSPATSDDTPSFTRLMSKRRAAQSSVNLRKDVPVDLLAYEIQDALSDDLRSSLHASPTSNNDDRKAWKFWYKLFLNPKFPLRRQMMLSFGSVGVITIVLVMIVSASAARRTGVTIRGESGENVEVWVEGFMGSTARLVAEALSPKIMPVDLINWMVEVGRDRFAGYPDAQDDSQTPFFDILSQSNVYPLQNNPLPLDWDFSHTTNEMGNVNNETQVEHVQGRYPLYAGLPRLSTTSGMYIMQGGCDPRVTDPASTVYYRNCSEDNNNVTIGGIVQPSPTNEQIYRKGADLGPFMKAFYEYHQDLFSMGYYFANSGAGAVVHFPHYEMDSTGSYVSIGCDWMRTQNPIDPSLGSIGTEEEIARCRPEGTVVPSREYNPLERAWCRDQTLDPFRVHNSGPYISAFDGKSWFMSAGKSFFDHQTGKFVACLIADLVVDGIEQLLEEVKIDELGVLTLVQNNNVGTVASSPYFDFDTANETTTIDDPSLQTGVDQVMFAEIKSTVNFTTQWDPEEASKAFETATFQSLEHLITAYPIPSIPDTYDPNYRPEFFAIFSLPKGEGIASINEELNQMVDENVWSIIQLVIIIGCIGLLVVLVLILTTASWFVRPLKWMSKVGEKVLGSFGQVQTDDSGIEFKKKNDICTPKTELDSLVQEFEKMVARFSGEGTAARRMQISDTEKFNTFEFSNEFASLYESRQDGDFDFKYPNPLSGSNASAKDTIEHCFLGRNTRDKDLVSEYSNSEPTKSSGQNVYKSSFFLWMVGLIVTPVLITTIIISVVVLTQISTQLPTLTNPIDEEYMDIKDSFRTSAAGLLASQASAVMSKAARDTHVLTRFANWLYFGGMDISDAFIDALEGAEDCKAVNEPETCTWKKDFAVCDCAWNDFFVRGGERSCSVFPPGESRALQKIFFEAQSQDVDESGSRSSTSYPDVAYYPNTTAWWDNITSLPQAATTNTKYDSSFDRVQILSALSTVFLALYNYDTSNDKLLASYIGFEADGMMAGYQGCEYGFVRYPFWRSTEANGASKIRPELCPLGKYGFDSRCRGWYGAGKSMSLSGNGTLHITAPYIFAGGAQITGQSTSSPIMQGDVHIGQTIIDFIPSAIFRSLTKESKKLGDGAFPILITPTTDAIGHDVVMGPGFSLSGDGEAIKDLLNADESIDLILQDMKAGNSGSGSFLYGQEHVYITYAPVSVKNVFPVNSSDITRGVKNQTTLIYSLALVELESTIMQSSQSIDASISRVVGVCIGVLSALIILSAVLMLRIAFRVATYMTEPILELLEVLKEINHMRASKDDIVKLKRHRVSCREVDNVYKTIEMLYTVVQYANVAFFSGDLSLAFKVLRDALRLFTRLENNKAIAVACNNLGNTMLTVYRTMKATEEKEMCGMTKELVIEKGMTYFAQSIKLGEEAYDKFYNEQGWSEECLVFMQYLANRYFNRAIFLLTTSADHKEPNEAVALGFRDLQIVIDMDVEIVDQCTDMRFNINRGERFELMISRIRGLLALVEMGFSPDELYIEDQVIDVHNELKTALKNPSHDLFKEIGIAGRMQKLDTELIKYLREAKKDNISAAKVAIRMLVEDEYLFHDAEVEATKMLIIFLKESSDLCPSDTDDVIAKELASTVEKLEKDYDEKRSSYIRSSLNSSSGLSRETSKIYSQDSFPDNDNEGNEDDVTRRRRSSSYRNSALGDFTMENF